MSIVHSKLRNRKKILHSLPEIIKNIKLTYRQDETTIPEINVIELHLTDRCDLHCNYCSYKNHIDAETLSEKSLYNIMLFKPKAIVLAGGGEPTLFRDSHMDINGVIDFFYKRDISVGLITNGSKKLKKESYDKLKWLRVSLDASNQSEFFALKKGKFSTRLDFLRSACESECKYIGVGYLYGDHNIRTLYDACYELYNIFSSRINIQFRAVCNIQSCTCPSSNYANERFRTSDLDVFWKDEIKYLKSKLCESKYENYDYHNFILNNTNLCDVLDGNKSNSLNFEHCFTALSRWVIRANGNIYPCVMKATNKARPICNIMNLNLQEINNNLSGYYNLSAGYCNGVNSCCRLVGEVNNIVMDSVGGVLDNLDSNDYFY
ncbi:radical SAM protein [Pseudocitrobacter corydidari]